MQTRQLGKNGPTVSAVGLGCMGISQAYGTRDEAESLATMDRAFALGITFFDTADIYGMGHNEEFVGRALRGRRDGIVLATKCGFTWDENGKQGGVNGSPDYIRAACEASLRRLNVEVIDLYYLHRADPNVPIEDSIGAMSGLVAQGKIRFLGLSEVSSTTLHRAHAVHPITALQNEYSLWTRDADAEAIPTCRELGIGFVPFSPLGRGFLTGQIKSPDDFPEGDMRRTLPRFMGENFQKNIELVHRVEELAAEKHCTPAQLALAWVLAQGDDMVPIPGTKRRKYLEENVAALQVDVTRDDQRRIEEIFSAAAVAGPRYPDALMKLVNG
ncbi:MAG TPA: aldo/keto reductase [Pyrinomonadaceae bacterium]|nr:aldo/keto reductase [Pyrinomonadaceae bacterium]